MREVDSDRVVARVLLIATRRGSVGLGGSGGLLHLAYFGFVAPATTATPVHVGAIGCVSAMP